MSWTLVIQLALLMVVGTICTCTVIAVAKSGHIGADEDK